MDNPNPNRTEPMLPDSQPEGVIKQEKFFL